jgi:hypothetical protein
MAIISSLSSPNLVMKRLFFSSLFLFFVALLPNEAALIILHDPTTNISKVFENHWSVAVDIVQSPFTSLTPKSDYESESWWGALDTPPKTIVDSIIVTIDGKKAYFTKAMYDYLGNPRSAKIEELNGKFVLSIFGGDNGTNYTAVFTFSQRRLLTRRIQLNELPDDVYEVTTYVSKVRDND